jgi:hypothetical protein
MPLIEKIAAATIVLVCVLLLIRQFIGTDRRTRIDIALQHRAHALRRRWRTTRTRLLRWYRWPAAQRAARRETEAAIRRARGDQRRRDDDPVHRKPSPKARKLH